MSMLVTNLSSIISTEYKHLEIANAVGVPYETVKEWISGEAEPSIDQLIILCNYLNTPIEDLVGDTYEYPQIEQESTVRSLNRQVKRLQIGLTEVTAERDKYKEIAYRADREVEAVKKYGDRYRNMVDTLKADGASKITIEF